MQLRLLRRATQDLHVAIRWWRANRPKAPELFEDELRHAFALLVEQPHVGQLTRDSSFTGARRFYLSGSRYFVYYRVKEAAGFVEVLRVWHASRGRTPRL